MPNPLLYATGATVAAVVSAVCILMLAWRRVPASAESLKWASLLAIAGGYASGCAVLQLHPAWPPLNALDRFLVLIFPATLAIELIATFERVPRSFIWPLRMMLAVAIGPVLLHTSVYFSDSASGWSTVEAVTLLVACGILLAAVWSLLAWLSQRSPGASVPLALALAIQCSGMAIMLAGYLKGGSASIALAAALCGSVIAVALVSKSFDYQPAISIGVVGLFSLVFIGRFFGRLETGMALALLSAPLLCWVTELPGLKSRKPWVVGSLRLALVAIPLIVVLVLAKRKFDRELAPLLGTTSAGPPTLHQRDSV